MEKQEKSFLVFDIETIEEDRGEGNEGARGGAVERKESGVSASRAFPPIYKHRIVTIGALWLSARFFFKKLGIFSEGKEEKAVVEDFNNFVSRKTPSLVSYNGRRFDVPVIFLRSMKYGLSMDWHLRTQEYTRRYPPTRHLDLCDILADYGASSFTSLDNMSLLVGLEGKKDMDGSRVQEEFEKGNLEKIQNYCLGDVVLTTCLFLRFLLVSGEVSPSYYNECLDSVVAGVVENGRALSFVSEQELAGQKVPV